MIHVFAGEKNVDFDIVHLSLLRSPGEDSTTKPEYSGNMFY